MDAIDLLCADHRRLERYFLRFRSILAAGHSQLAPRRKLIRELTRDLTAHAELEAIGIYPLLRETSARAAEQVDRALVEHGAIAALLHENGELRTSITDFDANMVILFEKIRDHFAEEEHALFPRLRRRLGEKGLRQLGLRLQQQA